jgi:5'-3' exonuclease
MSQKPLIIIDFSNLCWAAYFASDKSPDPVWNQQYPDYVRIFDQKMQNLSLTFRVSISDFLFVKDNHPAAKYEAYPEYKAGRNRDEHDPRPNIEGWGRERGWQFRSSPNHEADDAIASIVTLNKNVPSVIVSADRDLWQLLENGWIAVYDPVRRTFIDKDYIKRAFGVDDPKHIRLTKSLWGDDSDNLPNCCPRMQRWLLPLIQQSDGTLDSLLKMAAGDGNISERCAQLIGQNMAQIELNYRLVGLNRECEVWES